MRTDIKPNSRETLITVGEWKRHHEKLLTDDKAEFMETFRHSDVKTKMKIREVLPGEWVDETNREQAITVFTLAY